MALKAFIKTGICLFFTLSVAGAMEQEDNVSINIMNTYYNNPSKMEIGVEYDDQELNKVLSFSVPAADKEKWVKVSAFPKGILKKITCLWLNDTIDVDADGEPTLLATLTLLEIEAPDSLSSISLKCGCQTIEAILGYNATEDAQV